MYCRKCGEKLDDGMKFCPVCGAVIKKVEEENKKSEGQKKGKRVGIIIGVCIVLFIAAAIAAFFILKQQREKTFTSSLTAGNKYLEELDYERAEESFLEAIKVNPKAREPYAKLAELYVANDEIEKAQDIVEQAVKNVSADDKKEFEEKQKEWEHLENYEWVVSPEIEADDIYYLKGDDAFLHPGNEMQKQLENRYAVIKQGTTYGLIDLEGNWYEDIKCNQISTILEHYELKTETPIYSELYSTDLNDYYLTDTEQLEPTLSLYGDTLTPQGTYYYVEGSGLHNSTEIMEDDNYSLNELTSAIPIRQSRSIYEGKDENQSGSWLYYDIERWLDDRGSKYAIWNNNTLITDFIYDECGSENSGLLAVKKDGKWGYVDETGKEIIKIEYDASWNQYPVSEEDILKEYCYAASCGYVPLVKEGVWELRNTKGNLVVAPGVFEAIRPPYEGKCWVKKNGKWGVISLENPTEDTDDVEDNNQKKITEISDEQIYKDLIQAYGKYFYSYGKENSNYIDLSDMGIANPYHGLYPARTEDSEYIYYALYDVNNDGHKECFFTSDVGTEQENAPGYYDIWTNDGENASLLLKGGYRSYQFVCADGTIKNYGSGGAWASQVDFYSFDDKGTTKRIDSYSTDGNSQGMTYYDELQEKEITQEEMQAIEDRHPRADVQFEWIKINEETQ